MPMMEPATSERNFTPSSTALSGPASMMAGVGLLGQMEEVAGLIAMLRAFVAVCAPAVTLTVTLAVPVAVGVPEITPVLVASVSPLGSTPAEIDQLYGGVPPTAASVAE